MKWPTVAMIIGFLIGWVAKAYGAESGLYREYAEFRARLAQCAQERGLDVEVMLTALPEEPAEGDLLRLREDIVRRNAACQDRPVPAASTASSFVRANPFNDPPPLLPPPVPVIYGQAERPIADAAHQYEVHNTSFGTGVECWLRISVDGVVVRWSGARTPDQEPFEPIPPEQVSEYLPPTAYGHPGYFEADAGAHLLTYSCHPVRSRSVAIPAGLVTSRTVDERPVAYGRSRIAPGRIEPGALGGGALWASR